MKIVSVYEFQTCTRFIIREYIRTSISYLQTFEKQCCTDSYCDLTGCKTFQGKLRKIGFIVDFKQAGQIKMNDITNNFELKILNNI